MVKIYYNEQGWICDRYPYDIPITDDSRYIEVNDDIAGETYSCEPNKSWRVVNQQLVVEKYQDVTQQELYEQEYQELIRKLADMDYKTSKYVDGEYTEEEWQEIVNERKQIRVRVRELEPLING